MQSFEILLSLGWIPPIENVFNIALLLLRFGFGHRCSLWFNCRSRSSLWLRFDYREINCMDGSCRTLCHTLLAKLALSVVDVSHIVLHCDSLKRTNLRTLAAAYTCSLAGLACDSTLVLVDA